MFRETGLYAGMARGLKMLLRAPAADYQSQFRAQLERRSEVFLENVRRAIFANAEHPYCRMFRIAGCSYDDLAETVRRDGLEAALEAIRGEGVYLTHDEFKGKSPIVRSGRHIPTDEHSFRNPLVPGLLEASSSGSRSRGTKTPQSLPFLLYQGIYVYLGALEFDLLRRANVLLMPILPSPGAISICVGAERYKRSIERWFAAGGTWSDSAPYRALTDLIVRYVRSLGVNAPFPTYLPENDFSPVAEWIAAQRAKGVACNLTSYVSPAVRVAAAAAEKGLDVSGTIFSVSGETLTEPKRAVIEGVGAEVRVIYGSTEVGLIGASCRQMKAGNCVHLYRDALAVISHRRRAPLTDAQVDSLLFTTLLPFAPHLFINTEMDDAGVIGRAGCDCAYSRAGLTDSIRDIGSFGKLTGQGITLVGSDIARILEEDLPARFGGHPGDYQVVEHDGASQTEITLRVSPRIGAPSMKKMKRYFLRKVRGCYGGALASRVWNHADGLEVVIAEPFATSTGKVLPLHLIGSGARETAHV